MESRECLGRFRWIGVYSFQKVTYGGFLGRHHSLRIAPSSVRCPGHGVACAEVPSISTPQLRGFNEVPMRLFVSWLKQPTVTLRRQVQFARCAHRRFESPVFRCVVFTASPYDRLSRSISVSTSATRSISQA